MTESEVVSALAAVHPVVVHLYPNSSDAEPIGYCPKGSGGGDEDEGLGDSSSE